MGRERSGLFDDRLAPCPEGLDEEIGLT